MKQGKLCGSSLRGESYLWGGGDSIGCQDKSMWSTSEVAERLAAFEHFLRRAKKPQTTAIPHPPTNDARSIDIRQYVV